jgi:hypothetical protein
MDISTELGSFLGERRALIDAIARELRAGASANAVAREVAPAFSRDQVKEYAAAIALQDTARKALREAGLDGAADVRATGIDPPREAHLNLAAVPSEPGYASLPGRIRAALRDYHITLALPHTDQAECDEITDGLIDKVLLDGERVRLVKLKPRK